MSRPAPTTADLPEGAIEANTEGGCIGNPGPAGLGYPMVFPDGARLEKGEPLGQGTGYTAERTAILRVLDASSTQTAPLRIFADSSCAIGRLTTGWKARANGPLIANSRQKMATFTDLQVLKMKGHAGPPEVERVDQRALESARTQKLFP